MASFGVAVEDEPVIVAVGIPEIAPQIKSEPVSRSLFIEQPERADRQQLHLQNRPLCPPTVRSVAVDHPVGDPPTAIPKRKIINFFMIFASSFLLCCVLLQYFFLKSHGNW